ncbi:transposase [Pigmentiphaga sp. CHJ604]|uniref:IS66-like element accessory protein TnpA n=1 Tax=Pigmentiphaga sp. CHJ604 TaxID=3081984 RepID=UPI0030D3FFEB
MTPTDLAIQESLTPRRPPRRSYSKAFKAQLIAESRQAGASIAGVALAHGVNANLLHKWIRAARSHSSEVTPSFVPVALSQSLSSSDQCIELQVRRGDVQATIHWPVAAADAFLPLLREWLR